MTPETIAPSPSAPPPRHRPPALPGERTVARLDNGLTVALVSNPQAPVVTTALWYRAGCRDEGPEEGGIAHFLEHMMFKGSRSFGPGEVDRITQRLGGDNNAFTSHDATAYYFQLAADRWHEALTLEADRMASLALEPEQVESERRVILEEISMYEDEPWERLSQRMDAELYGEHPYGRQVLGSRESLAQVGPDELRSFHRRFYRPGNAVLVVAGDLGDPRRAADAVARAFADVPDREPGVRPPAPPRPEPHDLVRVETHRGEVARLALELATPAADHPAMPALRIATAVLGDGRRSRLNQALVDEAELCSWVGAELSEALDPGALSVAAETHRGSDRREVEETLLATIASLADDPPGEAEVERARQVVLAEWTFGHERLSQQALAAGSELALYQPGWWDAYVERLKDVTATEVAAAAREHLGPEHRGVLGWSLPADEAPDAETGGER